MKELDDLNEDVDQYEYYDWIQAKQFELGIFLAFNRTLFVLGLANKAH